MAERRMFAKTIVTSDAFLDMPMSARCLYFTLGLFADDDGFVNSPKAIMRQIGASDDDMRVLLGKKFVLDFDSGMIVIKHWRINNYLRSDRYRPTTYTEELAQLSVDGNGAYTKTGIPAVDQRYPQARIGKDRIGKDSKGECQKPPTQEEVESYCKDRHNSVDAKRFYNYYAARGWETNGTHIRDWKALIRSWEPKDMGDPEAKGKRLKELELKKAELIAAGADKSELETIELNIQSIKDVMEVET